MYSYHTLVIKKIYIKVYSNNMYISKYIYVYQAYILFIYYIILFIKL